MLLSGRYELVELLAEGQQGAVYRARDSWNQATVAVKILKEPPDPEGVRVWADLRHPNIVKILDAFFGGEKPYLTMEYVDGPTLREAYLSHGEETLLHLLHGISHALHVAHARGVCHGDLKPANILVERGSEGAILKAKLTDFGLWRKAGTQSEGFSGTLAYAAPEVLRGEALDYRSDLYSLGASIYEVITGQPVFQGEDLRSVVEAHLAEDPVDPRVLNPSVSSTLAELVMQLLAKEPLRRLQSVEQHAAIAGDTAVDPPQLGEPAWIGRHRAWSFVRQLEGLAAKGQGSVALVVGEEDIGKSTFLRRLELDLGIRGKTQLFISCAANPPQAEAAEELMRRIKMLAGENRLIVADDATRSALTGRRARVFIEASRILAGNQHLVVLLDDVNCSDNSVLEFLKSVVPLVATERLLLLASLDREGLRILQAAIPNLLALPHVRRISFRSFTREETKQLVASQLSVDEVDSDVIDLLYDSSGGNPGLACEVVRQLVIQGFLKRRDGMWITEALPDPEALSAAMTWVVDSKLRSLNPMEHRVLGIMALLGAQVPREVIEEISGDSIPDLMVILRTLLERELIVQTGSGWALRHGLLAGPAASVFSEKERVELHAKAARVIQTRWPDDPSWTSALVHHLAGSGRRTEAFERGAEVADAALKEQRYSRALQLFGLAERCVADHESERELDVLKGQAACHMALGQWSSACNLFARLFDCLSAQGLPADDRAMLELSYAKALAAEGKQDESTKHLQRVLGMSSLSKAVRSEALAAAAHVAAEGRRWGEAEEYARSCLEQIDSASDDQLRSKTENTLGVALLMQGRLEEARIHLESSYGLREKAGDTLDAGRCALNLGILHRRLGEYADAGQSLATAMSRFESVGAAAWQAQACNMQGMVELASGFPRKAALLFERSVRLAFGCGRWRSAGSALNNLGLSLSAEGERGQALGRFKEAMALARRKGNRNLNQIIASNLGDYFLATGDLDVAEGWYTQAKAMAQHLDNDLCFGNCMRGFAKLRREQDELDQAERCLEEAMRALERSGDERSLLHARCELAELRTAQGRRDKALESAEQAAKRLEQLAAVDEAMVLRTLGKTKADLGRPEETAQAFKQCLDLVEATESVEGIALARLEVGRWLARGGPVKGFRAAERYLSQAKHGFQRLGARLRIKEAEDLLDELASTTPGGGVMPSADSRKLASVYRMMTLVNSAQSSEGILDQVLDLAVHAIHGERGLIILVKKDGGTLVVRAKTEIDGATITDARRISETVVKEVAGAGVPVFAADALHDVRFSEQDSIKMNRITCFMCVPLPVRGQIVGTIYVDSCNLGHRFTEEDVSYLTAFANQAAIAMENLRLREELEEENKYLQDQLRTVYSFDTLVGRSPAMELVYNAMTAVARSPVTVVIQGETGTGKELVAKAIHYSGPRSRRKFVTVNCSALPDTLLDSELFGYVRGAFTGAVRTAQGLFLLADGGTIFLDEITDMSPDLQAKLLRVLETGEVKQLGQPTTRRVDVRVICATNKVLEKEMLLGRFREDLYYRLKVVTIKVPPLRERLQDIPLLAVHFLNKYNEQFGKEIRRFSEDAVSLLCSIEWPGNVRELEHAIEAAIALCPGKVITTDTLSMALGPSPAQHENASTGLTLLAARRSLERRYITQALQDTGWNVSAAARKLSINRRQVQRLMRRYELGTSPRLRRETEGGWVNGEDGKMGRGEKRAMSVQR